MILAGIDEAGYGPLLGPLVVGCAAFELADVDAANGALPCVWKQLGKLVGKTRSKTGRKIHVNDSKLVYSPAAGLRELERSILSLAMAGGPAGDDACGSLDALIGRVAPHAVGDLGGHPWYAAGPGERFPLENDPLPLKLFANGLRAEMTRTGCECVHLAARVLPERQYNRMVEATRNKGSALFSTAAIHLDHLIRTYGHQGLVIFCDRQGGRTHYGGLLRLMFEDWSLEVTSETDSRAEYRLYRRGPGNAGPADVVRIIFTEKAEAQCLPVAVASMLSKYLRETLMHRFNAWWAHRVPGIAPTAGYYNDGLRFLDDIADKRRELNVGDELLVRAR